MSGCLQAAKDRRNRLETILYRWFEERFNVHRSECKIDFEELLTCYFEEALDMHDERFKARRTSVKDPQVKDIFVPVEVGSDSRRMPHNKATRALYEAMQTGDKGLVKEAIRTHLEQRKAALAARKKDKGR